MRITCIINGLSTGGAERNLLLVANDAARRGDAVTIVTFDDGSSAPSFPIDPAIRRVAMNRGTKKISGLKKVRRLLSLPFALRRAIVTSNPDIVLAFMDQANLLTIMALSGTGIPCIVSERANPAFSSLLTQDKSGIIRCIVPLLRNTLYRRPARIVMQTERATRYFPDYLQSKIGIIPNPIASPAAVTATRATVILCVGRLDPQKRFDLVIKAFAEIAETFPAWRLRIAGDGPMREKLTAQAAYLGVVDRIQFAGTVTPVEGEYNRASIFVLSSDCEGFPTALGEAMAHGMAVIATDCDYGPRELIQHGKDGLLIPCGDSAALARSLKMLLESDAQRVVLGGAARAVVTRFPAAAILKQWEDLFRTVNAGKIKKSGEETNATESD